MPVTRTYGCDDCEAEWTVMHASSDEPYPECPQCSGDVAWRPKSFAITGIKSKAIDIAQGVAESMGMTDLKDNTRPGDTQFVAPPPIQSAEAQQIVRSFVEAGHSPEVATHLIPQVANYWQGQSGAVSMVEQQARAAVQSGQAAAASRQAASEGVDGLSVLKSAPKMKYNVMGSSTMETGG